MLFKTRLFLFQNQTIIIISFITLVMFTFFGTTFSLYSLISYALKHSFFSEIYNIYAKRNLLCLQLWSLYPGRQPRQYPVLMLHLLS